MNFRGNQFAQEQPAQPLRGCGMSKDSSAEAINSHRSLLSLLSDCKACIFDERLNLHLTA